MEPVEEQINQWRIKGKVDRVFEYAPLIRSYKDSNGRRVDENGPTKWYVHFENSYESLCYGKEEPFLAPGDLVDIIIRKRT